MGDGGTRTEKDSMGSVEVPKDAWYGASTARAAENFPISSRRFGRSMIRALGLLKAAAAEVNRELGVLDVERAEAIAAAAHEVARGDHDDQFVVDVFQTGSGTSTNMNANEVIANLAAVRLGGSRGDRDRVHPNDHVNYGQSSNDIIPTALQFAACMDIDAVLRPGLSALHAALENKAEAFRNEIKTGRTHLQDATPIRLGQVFHGYAGQIERGLARVARAEEELAEVALGGTAVGTGLNTHAEFASRVCALASKAAGVEIRETSNHFQAQATLDSVVAASGALRTVAVSLHKIANDIRWLASGPRCGLGELSLPAVQPGSSIMPGKVNPVIAESMIQAAAQVVANDLTIVQSGLGSVFELNTMLPVAASNLHESIGLLGRTAANFAERCVRGLTATGRGAELVEQGLSTVTGLVPAIGYDRSAAIAKQAAASGKTVREVAREEGIDEATLTEGLDPFKMTRPEGAKED
ncbi:MAG: class II fumarate hydratase [Planctomycetota bacterium]|nr:class II fumarate hydratase [Planctomycetota bacterium]